MRTINLVKGQWLGAFLLTANLFASANAAPVTVTNNFTDGQVLTADQLNNNFNDVKTAVDDNDSRVTALEAASSSNNTRTISIPARAMAFDPGSATISFAALGLTHTFSFLGGTSFRIRKPADYASGDITMSILFKTTTATAGVVNFFIRPTSFNSGEGIADLGSLSSLSTGVAVAGDLGLGSGALYEQNITIPESRLTKDWWTSSIQREGTGATYSDPVTLLAVSLEYTANP